MTDRPPPLPMLMVAPNGARLRTCDHPAIPVTLPGIVACAAACHAAGAGGLHLHLRDEQQRHLLDAGACREALAELAARVPGMQVQITTEAAGRYEPREQRAVARASGARMISASIRELCRDSRKETGEFCEELAGRGVAVQHILYDAADGELLAEVLPPALFRDSRLQLLFVCGRRNAGGGTTPGSLTPFLDWMRRREIAPDWAVCAFGAGETDCLLHAARAGGKCRVGFENSLLGPDGVVAVDNAARVREMAIRLAELAAATGDGRPQG